MAKLTKELDFSLSGKPVRDMPGGGSGAFSTALSSLSGGLDAFMDRKKQLDSSRRQAEADALKAGERTAERDSVLALGRAQDAVVRSQPVTTARLDPTSLSTAERADRASEGAPLTAGVFDSSEPEFPEEVVRDANKAGGRIKSVEAAVSQATMPGISLNAAMQKEFNSLITKYPEHTTAIIETLKKLGVDNALFRSIRAEQAEYEAVQTSNLKLEEDAFRKGVEVLGDQIGSMSRADVAAVGIREFKSERNRDMLKQERELAQINTNISKTEREQAEKDFNQRALQQGTVDAYNSFAPMKTAIQQALVNIDQLPIGPQEKAFQQLAPLLEQQLVSYADRAVAQAAAMGYTGDLTAYRAQVMSMGNAMLEPFKGDITTAKSNLAALSAVETRLKINTAEAMPVFTALKQMGLSTAEIDVMTSSMALNPELIDALRTEIKGFTTDFGKERASTRIINIVRLLQGKTGINEMKPGEAEQALAVTAPAARDLSRKYVQGQAIDPTMVLSSIGTVITATRTIDPGSSFASIVVASESFATPTNRKALKQIRTNPNEDVNDMGEATILASRAASSHILENMIAKVQSGEGAGQFHSMGWDKKNGRWAIAFDVGKYNQALAMAKPRRLGSGEESKFTVGGRTPNKEPPQALVRMAQIANMNLDNIMELKEFDANTPKGTDLELRNYYGNNVLPPSMREAGAAKRDPERAVDDILETIRESFETLPDMNEPVSLPPATKARNDYADNPNLPVVEAAAVRYGIPPDVAVALIAKESSFNPNAPHRTVTSGSHKGDRAWGLGAVMPKTAAKYGISPDQLQRLTPDAQAALSMMILRDNYEVTGNWRDAVSMYFTGRPEKKARKQAARDTTGTSISAYMSGVFG